MLPCKDIKNIWELKNGFTHSWVEPEFITSSLKLFSFSQLSKPVSEIKKKGYSFEWIMTVLLSMPFMGIQTVNSMLNGFVKHQIEAGKDTFYRLKNHSQINWRLLLWLFASQFKKLTNRRLNKVSQGPRCMIFDDTLLEKTGKRIEKVSRVFDHVTRRSVLGFKLLLMGYWDSVSFIPVDFVVDYVLVDSWFTCEALIDAVLKVRKYTTHLIGMYKIARTKFLFHGKELTHSQIRNMLGKPRRCRKLKLYYMVAEVEYNGTPVKLFFSKKGSNGKWKVFICTNTRLSFIEMIEIYQIRWTIEVFFKESKQLLGLGRCQSNDFDAQIADATITMLQHILLTMRYRIEKYESMQGLFSELTEKVIQERLDRRLWGLFVEILNIIESLFDGIDEDELIKRIFHDENARKKIALLLNEPEMLSAAA